MITAFVDTDVLIRLLTGDDPAKQRATQALFERVERGELVLSAPDTVIADAVFVLASRRLYNLPRAQIDALLTPLVRLPGFRVKNRRTVLRALDLYGRTPGLDFGDAMIAAAAEMTLDPVLYSYDRDFDQFPAITRQEP
jgi:predicted nucleic acid-binding protein